MLFKKPEKIENIDASSIDEGLYLAVDANGNIIGASGGGGGGDTIITGHVVAYTNLPTASSYTGKYYIVDTTTGTWILGTKKSAGLYKSNGTIWVYIDNVPETTSLSDGTTVITGTNIILEGGQDISTTTDVNNNKITIASTAYADAEIDSKLLPLDGNGVISGMAISINADPTKINISSGVYHINNGTNFSFAGITAQVLTYLTTNNVTYLAIRTSDNTLIQSITPFLMANRRDYVFLGAAIHSNSTTVNAINNLPDVALYGLSQLNDLIDGLKNFNKEGNIFSANGANLFINKSAGKIFKKGVNFTIDTKNPHVKTLDALVAPSNIRYRLSDGTEYPDTQAVSKYYESAPGVRTIIPNTEFSIQRITVFPSNLVRIQYGQEIYNTLALAKQNIFTEGFITESNISENGLLRGFLIVRGNATDLSDETEAIFITADKFGELPIGNTGSTTSLQQAYDNSITPEITTNTTLGAVSIKRGSTSDTDNVFEVLNGTGAITTSIDGLGNIQSNNNVVIRDQTGFRDCESVISTYDKVNRTITLTGTVEAYWQGKPVSELTNGWVSDPHPAGKTVAQYLYYDGTNFVWSDNYWTFDMLQIGYTNYLGATIGHNGRRETHGFMPWTAHRTEHLSTGTIKLSGGASSGTVLNSTTTANRRPDISESKILDEDLESTIPLLTTKAYAQNYLSGTASVPVNNVSVSNADIVRLSTNRPYYNLLTGGNWTEVLMSNNGYASVYVFAVPATADADSQLTRYVFVQGQTQNIGGNAAQNATALAAQLAVDPRTIVLGALTSPEVVAVWQYVIKYDNTNWTIVGERALIGSKTSPVSVNGTTGLSTVATDATLTGSGLLSDPLSVVQNYVTLTGDQTIAGIKTFSTAPICGTASMSDATNKRFCTDAEKVIIGNTSNINTGDEPKLKVYPICTDDFSIDLGGYEVPSYSTGVYSISGGQLLTRLSTGLYFAGMIRNKSIRRKNGIYKTTITTTASNVSQIRVRETDQNNFLNIYLSFLGSSRIRSFIGGVQVVESLSNTITGFSTSNNYNLVAKVFSDYVSSDILYNGNVVASVEVVSDYFNMLTGDTVGLAGVSTTADDIFNDFSNAKIDNFISVICLGDSLTSGTGLDTVDTYPSKLKTSFINYPIGFTNKGVAGDKISNVVARLGTSIIPNNVADADKNIILLMIGTNDRGVAPATVMAEYEALVQNMQKFGFEVWAITIPPRDDNAEYRTFNKNLNTLIKASTVPNKIIDFYANCVDGSDVTLSGYLQEDEVHLTTVATGVLRDLISVVLKSDLKIV